MTEQEDNKPIWISAEVHKRIKVKAAKEEKTMSQLLAETFPIINE